MLKILLNKTEYDALSEAIKEHYVVKDEGYVLDSDGSDFTSRINEFRSNNIKLRKEVEGLTADALKFKDVDLEKYNEAVAKLQEIEEKQLLDAGQIEDVIQVRTERMRADYDGKVTALETSLTESSDKLISAQSVLTKELLGGRVAATLTGIGKPVEGGLPFIVNKASEIWKLKDEDLVPMNGTEVIYDKAGKAVITMKEWLTDFMDESPFLFEGSKGTGALGNGGSNSGNASVIDRKDSDAFSSNLERIAKGEVKAV